MLPLTSCPSSLNAGSATPPNTTTPQSTWFFRNLCFRFQGFRGFFVFFEYRERKVAVRTVSALVAQNEKREKNPKPNLGLVGGDQRAGRKNVCEKGADFLHSSHQQIPKRSNCKPQPHNPRNSRPLRSFLFSRTLVPIVQLSIFLHLTETVHKTDDQKGEKTFLLGGNRRARRTTTTPARIPYAGNKLPHNKAHRHSEYRATMTLSHVMIQLQIASR